MSSGEADKPFSMILWAMVLATLVVAGVFITLTANPAIAQSPAGVPRRTGVHPIQGQVSGIPWQERDRAIYVVTKLNLPLCSDGRQLKTVLSRLGARFYDVLSSTANRDLYFIEVRTAINRLLGVYAYRFGALLPRGVQGSRCVRPASATVIKLYRSDALTPVIRFNTTTPE